MTANTNPQADQMTDLDMVKEFQDNFQKFETFVSRRFDEISMEINATSQQIDMNDDSVSRRLGELLEVLGAISYAGNGDTPANAGIELEAVIRVTEEAANKILDNADGIAEKIEDDAIWEDKEKRGKALESISTRVHEILMACSFQDITGQRIRTTLDNLKGVEDRLNQTLNKLGIEATVPTKEEDLPITHGTSQNAIDELFD